MREGVATWQRQLVLGPGREYALLGTQPPGLTVAADVRVAYERRVA